MSKSGTGMILQARTASSRLPGKILLPFHNNSSLLELLIRRLKNDLNDMPIVVATSTSSDDDPIEDLVKSFSGVSLFRGDENNVLKRFIDAADYFGFSEVIRVCSDNLFIDTSLIRELLSEANRTSADYISHRVNGDIPVIRSHQGFYTEWITKDALKKITTLTSDHLYFEHVTNYIYTHRDKFRIKLLNAPELVYNMTNLRLTVDTEADFINAQKVYTELISSGKEISIENILHIVFADKQMLKSMNEQIKLNSK